MGQRFAVGAAGSIPENTAKVVRVGERYAAVFYVGGAYLAIDDCCPHAGASLAGGHVQDGCVTCPWHAWRFRLSDGTWADSPRVRTKTFHTIVEDGVVYVLDGERQGICLPSEA